MRLVNRCYFRLVKTINLLLSLIILYHVILQVGFVIWNSRLKWNSHLHQFSIDFIHLLYIVLSCFKLGRKDSVTKVWFILLFPSSLYLQSKIIIAPLHQSMKYRAPVFIECCQYCQNTGFHLFIYLFIPSFFSILFQSIYLLFFNFMNSAFNLYQITFWLCDRRVVYWFIYIMYF